MKTKWFLVWQRKEFIGAAEYTVHDEIVLGEEITQKEAQQRALVHWREIVRKENANGKNPFGGAEPNPKVISETPLPKLRLA